MNNSGKITKLTPYFKIMLLIIENIIIYIKLQNLTFNSSSGHNTFRDLATAEGKIS